MNHTLPWAKATMGTVDDGFSGPEKDIWEGWEENLPFNDWQIGRFITEDEAEKFYLLKNCALFTENESVKELCVEYLDNILKENIKLRSMLANLIKEAEEFLGELKYDRGSGG